MFGFGSLRKKKPGKKDDASSSKRGQGSRAPRDLWCQENMGAFVDVMYQQWERGMMAGTSFLDETWDCILVDLVARTGKPYKIWQLRDKLSRMKLQFVEFINTQFPNHYWHLDPTTSALVLPSIDERASPQTGTFPEFVKFGKMFGGCDGHGNFVAQAGNVYNEFGDDEVDEEDVYAAQLTKEKAKQEYKAKKNKRYKGSGSGPSDGERSASSVDFTPLNNLAISYQKSEDEKDAIKEQVRAENAKYLELMRDDLPRYFSGNSRLANEPDEAKLWLSYDDEARLVWYKDQEPMIPRRH